MTSFHMAFTCFPEPPDSGGGKGSAEQLAKSGSCDFDVVFTRTIGNSRAVTANSGNAEIRDILEFGGNNKRGIRADTNGD